MSRSLLTATALTAIVSVGAWFAQKPAVAGVSGIERVFHHENVMGTALELRVGANSEAAATRAEGRALREIDRLVLVFSRYDPTSEFARWQAQPAGTIGRVSHELYGVLDASDRWRDASGGAFDPRVSSLIEVWSRASKASRVPTAAELTSALTVMTRPAWRLLADGRSVERTSDAPLTLNAIAKGAIVERACSAAFRPEDGVTGVLLNVGGDLAARGASLGPIGIADPTADSESAHPFATVEIQDRSVATSGGYQRHLDVNGRRHSHIIDPRSGKPAEGVLSATVVAPRGADADALATALCVLDPQKGLQVVRENAGVECLIVGADGTIHQSRGWGRFGRSLGVPLAFAHPAPRLPEPAAADAAEKAWSDDHELAVSLEINGADLGRRFRRPYVAVWLEDGDGFAVRTLALWVQTAGPGPRWIPDLKRWYRGEQERKLVVDSDLVATVSRATRPPGKYALTWDGKDDQGKPVAAGTYTLCIEAAREHGTYQIIRKPLKVGGAAFSEDLKGNVEIKSAAVAYRKKASAR